MFRSNSLWLLPALRTGPSCIPGLRGVFTDDLICEGQVVLHTLGTPSVSVHQLNRQESAHSRGISDHRFLALRHSWTSGSFFYFASGQRHCFDMILPTQTLRAIAQPRSDKVARPLLFEVNDPFKWRLPSADDVASSEYWRGFQSQLSQYTSTGHDVSNVTIRQASKGDVRGVALVATKDIAAGSEILLHYGVGWWVPKILGQVFLAVDSSNGIEQVRWVEALANPANGVSESGVLSSSARFPSISLKRQRCRWRGGMRRVPVLWNTATDSVASDEEVVAYIAWASCVNADLAARLAELFNRRRHSNLSLHKECVVGMRLVRRTLRKSFVKASESSS